MLLALLLIYVVGMAAWGYLRIRVLDRKLRENSRKIHPDLAGERGKPFWHSGETDDPNWPEQYGTNWPEK